MKRVLYLLAAVACSLISGTAGAASPSYSFDPFTLVPKESTVLWASNKAGAVLGESVDSAGRSTCYLVSGTKKTVIAYPKATATYCRGLNDYSTVVGYYTEDGKVAYGFLYSKGAYRHVTLKGVPTKPCNHGGIPCLVLDSLFPTAINDLGVIAGYAKTSIGQVLFTVHGSSFQLSIPPQLKYSVLTGINDAGDLVFYADDISGAEHAYLKHGSTYTIIDYPHAAQTIPGKINNPGQISGSYYDAKGLEHGFVRDGKTGQSYGIDDPAGHETEINGIDDVGTLVGESFDANGQSTGFIATGHVPD